MRYTKLFSSIIHSSIWQESKETRLVWITMLAMSDHYGDVEGSILGLANAAGVKTNECVAVLDILKAPDKWSRSQEFEGRRIEEIEGGWHILNYVTYRKKLSEEHRLEKQRERSRRYRERQKETERVTQNVTTRNEKTPHIDLDQDQELDLKLNKDQEKKEDHELLKIVPIPKPKKRKPKYPAGYGAAVWEAYSEGFERRYGVKPKRNAKQSSLACQLRERLGDADSVEVARYYPTSQNSFHIGRGHALAHLVSDAEKVWTEWMTGNQITTTGAREQDRLKKTGDGWARAIEKICTED